MVGNKYEIKPDEDLITPERALKGDLEMSYNSNDKIQRAIPANLTVIKELVRRDLFPFHYEIYGVSFLEIRDTFLNPWAPRSSALLLEQWGVGVSETKASCVYQTVNRKIGNERSAIIRYVMEEPKEKENKSHHPQYKESFEVLIEVMDEEREKLISELKS